LHFFTPTEPFANRRREVRRTDNRSDIMLKSRVQRVANLRWGLIALLLGLPLPIVLIAFLFFGGCR
jgi:hypothetical protein